MPDDLKPVLARQMEVYAGFLEHTDHHVGRLVDAIAELGVLDDTLVYVIIGDNGASAEGTLHGCFNELLNLNGAAGLETTEFMASRVDDFGTPGAYNHYAVGWAHAMDTPYQWTKQVASHWGGTRNGTIVRWPSRHRGRRRAAPPVPPRHRRGADRARSCRAARAGVRARRHPAALRGRQHGLQLRRRRRRGPAQDAVLRDVLQPRHLPPGLDRGDPALGRRGTCRADARLRRRRVGALRARRLDAGARHRRRGPRRLAHLQQLFLLEASKYKVFPLDDRRVERFNPDLAGRPSFQGNSQVFFGGMGRLTENVVLNVKNKSHAITVDVGMADGGSTGVLVAQGGAFGGWSLYLHEGRPAYCYNLFGLQQFHRARGRARAPRRPPGADGVRLRRRRARQGRDRGPLRRRQAGGQGRVEATVPMIFSGDETFDVGSDTGTPVSDDYTSRRERLHRPDPRGPARPGRRRPGHGPPDQPGGTDADRHHAPMARTRSVVGGDGASTRSTTITLGPVTVRDLRDPRATAGGVVVGCAPRGCAGATGTPGPGTTRTSPLPHVPGHELAGAVVEVGAGVSGGASGTG